MKFSEYVRYDGLGLAQLVKSKQVTAQELLETAHARAEQVNPKLNAIVIPMYEHARNKIKQQNLSDKTIKNKPFFGNEKFRQTVCFFIISRSSNIRNVRIPIR